MVQVTVSLLGLYEYDSTILDGLLGNLPTPDRIPKDYSNLFGNALAIDKNALIDMLLLDCAELEFLLPEPTIAKRMINSWAGTQRNIWQHLYNSLWYKYNPIWNKDGTKTYKETEQREKSGKTDNNTTINTNYEDSATGSTTRNENDITTNIHLVAGYNSDNFANESKDDITANKTITQNTSDNNTGGGNSATLITGTSGENENVTRGYEEIDRGNIGVTSSQQMIEQERQLVQFDLYDFIIKSFKAKFCLLIY